MIAEIKFFNDFKNHKFYVFKNKVSPKDDNIQFFPFPFADVSYLCVSPQQQKAPN